MPVAALSANPLNPTCLETSCLNQVLGLNGNDAAVQFSSCVAQFGSPVVSTVTPTETVYATATTTVEYIDIIVSLTTATSTLEETLTSYDSVFTTATEYTTTNVVTVATTVTGNPAPSTLKKMRKRKNCTKKPSSTLSKTETVPATEVPQTSTIETETQTITSMTSAVPICSDEAEYSSACSCIGAVSDITETVTATADISTSTIYETVSSAILSVSESVVNVVVTTVVVKPATVTATSTFSTGLETTTTVTSVLHPTQTSQLLIEGGPRAGRPLRVVNQYVQWASSGSGSGSDITFTLANGQPWLPGQPQVKLYVHSASSQVGVLYFQTVVQAAIYGDAAVTCGVNESGNLSCVSVHGVTGSRLTDFWQCGAYVYLARSGFQPAGCTRIEIKPAGLTYV
ncbi:hypothetical protein QBC40DRAFT_183724 [Triangularia verruculosa]|uniref:Uncharacterized protein n=1 Tax=Triangularia verruculosa TaxID=2587418 RepID=A0AAN6X9V8_9PEZI|nr:hypothetical protein QBC40DRAFT_183724 [Triangularia verruculosa]